MTAKKIRRGSLEEQSKKGENRPGRSRVKNFGKAIGQRTKNIRLRRQQRYPNTPPYGSWEDDIGGKGVGDDRRSKSSLDIRENSIGGADPSMEQGSPTQVSRRKKMWNSFKKSAKRFRSRSREKLSRSKGSRDDPSRLSASQPDISPNGTLDNQTDRDFDALFDAAQQRNSSHIEYVESGERSFSDPSMVQENGLDRSRSEEKESEVDSGIAVVEHSEATTQRQREALYRSHPFYQLDIVLKEGRDLVIRDSNGTSDPYVKFKIGGKQFYKSRTVFKNLNPKWDEKFSLPVEDAFKPIQVKVFDYDRGVSDDPMGGAEILPTQLELSRPQDLKLMLTEKTAKGKQSNEYMGFITMTCTLVPKTQDEKEQYFKKTMKLGESAKKLKTQIWSSVVTVVLVEGHDLLAMDDNGYSDPYVKFRLGNEKYKSKYKLKTLNPRWLEQFDLHMFDDHTSHLELSVWDHDTAGKDDIMGRAVINLAELAPEKTHTLDHPLEDGAGFIKLLVTVSGTSGGESVSDLANYTPNPREREDIIRKYGLAKSLKGIKDVGYLQVKVIKAQNLIAADLGGKSDPFCVLELVNARLQTQTEYKTLCPDWGKVFTFQVKDIHSILEVSVYDEDRDKKAEFLGKLAIPLLKVKRGEKRWYQLKDKKGVGRSKGAIMLEMDIVFNHVKAAIRTFNPREEKFMQAEPKFKISVMKRNIDRVTKIVEAGVESGKFIQSCFDWESKPRSITAFAVFLIIVWNFELYMLPITLLIIFLKNLLVVQIVGNLMKDKDEDEYVDEDDDEEEDDKDKNKKGKNTQKEEKKSFKEKLQQIQDVCLQVQESMDMVASMGERVKNTFNWTVPWLSWLAFIVLSIAGVVLYNVPIRYLILAWGINKFTKKLRAPNAIPNNELLDYLSRVPSDKELIMYRELRPDPGIGTMKKKRGGSAS